MRIFLLFSFFFSLLLTQVSTATPLVQAISAPRIECGKQLDATGAISNTTAGVLPGCDNTDTADQDGSFFGRVVPNIISWIIAGLGIMAFIILVQSGIDLIFSQGNAEKLQAVQKTAIAAGIGLFIALSSFILIQIASSFSLI